MSIKESILNWLKSSTQNKHRASAVEDTPEREKREESQPKEQQQGSTEKAEGHQDSDHQ